jgi:hypothetical protein
MHVNNVIRENFKILCPQLLESKVYMIVNTLNKNKPQNFKVLFHNKDHILHGLHVYEELCYVF